MVRLPEPLSRRDRQRQTREALIFAARAVFAREGYHGANLDLIAREAGFSKGAVYSNFAGKAALFLAVMDANVAAAMPEGWNVHDPSTQGGGDAALPEEARAAIKGFALATLEFIATAARDEELAVELGKRMQAVIRGYTAVAMESGADADPVPPDEMGALLAALDQGAALLSLSGSTTIDQRALRTGMQRLLIPASVESRGDEGDGVPVLHDRVIQERIAATVQEWPSS